MMIIQLCGNTSCAQGWSGGDRDTTVTGGGRSQGVGNFIQGGEAGDSFVWVGNRFFIFIQLDTHEVPVNDHREESETIRRWDMIDSGNRRHMSGRGNPVSYDLHSATADNRGTVGGAMSLI